MIRNLGVFLRLVVCGFEPIAGHPYQVLTKWRLPTAQVRVRDRRKCHSVGA